MNRDDQIRGYIAKWQPRLNLVDWEIRYEPSNIELNKKGLTISMAEVEYRLEEKVAQVRVDHDVPDKALEVCVVHELLHLVLKVLTFPLEAMVAQQKEPARGVLANLFEPAEEQVIETICRAFGLGPRYLSYDRDSIKKFPAFAA